MTDTFAAEEVFADWQRTIKGFSLLQVNIFDGYGAGLCGLLDCKYVFSKLFRSICISIDDGRYLKKALLSIAQISSCLLYTSDAADE